MKQLCVLLCFAFCAIAYGANAPAAPASQPAQDRDALEQKFIETMSGATLVGFYTANDAEGPPKEERYTISKVTKADGENFIIAAQIKFGERTISVPLSLPVKWAGDTPVITVSDVTIPGYGTYNARVMISGNLYAGTWSSPRHGGHLWGKIEKAKPAE